MLVDEAGEIIAGHGRVLAAERMQLVDVPVATARGWSEEEKRAYRIADNKLALNAGWDEAMLSLELGELATLGFDLPLIGFSQAELAGLLDRGGGLTDPDAAPEPPAAERKGIACFGAELSPAYVDVAVLRWQAFTGKAATLDGDGRTFAEIAAERVPLPAAAE